MSEIWRPSAARVVQANLTRFIEEVRAARNMQLGNYDDLYAWSIAKPTEFSQELVRFADVRADWGTAPAHDTTSRAG